ncbi:hypothetical protein G7054_g2510 [Neopestalotiopsis clavispora]|nr:hypothetical protein G7054_g2510 [Neopestalotiopsis clavispora]
MRASTLLLVTALGGPAVADYGSSQTNKPNIVMIMSDDQDLRLGSTDYQHVLHRDVHAKGTEFKNHYATTANCCPSRTSFFRGQMVHNTNITHVNAPGGNYDKFVVSGQDTDYLPFWLKDAGYRVEYIGKFLNGYSQKNYNVTPKGWDHIDALIDPYTYVFNTPVMSANGERPVWYQGYHQSDVIRAKALDRIEQLTAQDDPFFLMLAPSSPHIQNDKYKTIPLSRHANDFENATAPRNPNWNPADEYQSMKSSWMRTLPLMNSSVQEYADLEYRMRIRGLQGVDEIMEDVIALLEKNGVMDNTYFIYTTDNGYHIGTHRMPAGKASFFAEDTNLPFAVRGPGIPQGVQSKVPSAHLDLIPTFLELAGVPEDQWPPMLDGRSLVQQWKDPEGSTGSGAGGGNAKETINIEFWGLCVIEAPNSAELGAPFYNNSYKTLRIVGEDESWLLSVWCTGETELYNTAADPYELNNLAFNATEATEKLIDRLNALLLVAKSCEGGTCRQPWRFLQPNNSTVNGTLEILSLTQAMDPKYDDFFKSFPRFAFKECLQVQSIQNEQPFWPPLPEDGSGLGQGYREKVDYYTSQGEGGTRYLDSGAEFGSWDQRNATLADIEKTARPITDAEIYGNTTTTERRRSLGIEDPADWMAWIG